MLSGLKHRLASSRLGPGKSLVDLLLRGRGLDLFQRLLEVLGLQLVLADLGQSIWVNSLAKVRGHFTDSTNCFFRPDVEHEVWDHVEFLLDINDSEQVLHQLSGFFYIQL